VSPISNEGTVALSVVFSTTSISLFCIETSFLRADSVAARPCLSRLVKDQNFIRPSPRRLPGG
jgi:hypothetical protein